MDIAWNPTAKYAEYSLTRDVYLYTGQGMKWNAYFKILLSSFA